jgi:hypothetical protein
VHDLTVTETLSFPNADASPWSEDLPDEGWRGRFGKMYGAIQSASTGTVGLLGYVWSPTAGDDPTPDRNHMRLACVRVSPNAGLVHWAISREDRAACDLEKAKYVWNDWDG